MPYNHEYAIMPCSRKPCRSRGWGNVGSRTFIRSGVCGVRRDLLQSPLASHPPVGSSDWLLRAVSHLGNMVRRRSAGFDGYELSAGEVASAQAVSTGVMDRHSIESGTARQL